MRISTRIALITIAILLIAAVSGAAFNYFSVRHYRKTYPVPGHMYSVDGRKMHLYCIGMGSPTLILESAMGDDFLVWARVQPELARVTRVCSYDRAGLGWSEGRPGRRDANTIANQLHELLVQAAISDRLILVGHSLGGLVIRAYAAQFPEELVGLVLVDSSTPEQAVRLPYFSILFQRSLVELKWTYWKTLFGVPRVLGKCGQPASGYEAYSGLIKADDCIPLGVATVRREGEGFLESLKEVEHTGPFPNLEILIFSEDPDIGFEEFPANVRSSARASWNAMQEGLKQLSPRSHRFIAKGSSHYIQADRPELLNKEIPRLILQTRTAAAGSSDYGSTVTE